MVLHIDPTSRSLYGIISITSQSPACLTRILTANEVSPHHKQCGLWVGGWLVGCSAALQWHRSGYTYSFWNWVSNIGIGVKVYVYTWVRVNWQQFASDKTQPTRIFLPMRCIKCFSSIYPKHSYRHLVYVQKPLRLSLYVWYGVSHSMRRRCVYAHKKAITSAEQNSRSNYMIRMLKFDMTRPKFNPMGVCRVFDGGYVFDGTASLSLFALGVSVDFFTPSPLDPPQTWLAAAAYSPGGSLFIQPALHGLWPSCDTIAGCLASVVPYRTTYIDASPLPHFVALPEWQTQLCTLHDDDDGAAFWAALPYLLILRTHTYIYIELLGRQQNALA